MNADRIKELSKQATNSVSANFRGADWQREYEKKFAELVVRECAGIVADAVDHREPASTYVDKIKQHFGVE